jgi:hypothetical protein
MVMPYIVYWNVSVLRGVVRGQRAPPNGGVLIAIYLLSLLSGETRVTSVRPAFTRYMSACDVVSRADVEDAVGRRVGEGSEETEGKSSTCEFGTRGGLVSITIQQLTAKPDLAREVAALRKEMGEGTVRPAEGFDTAFYFDIPEAGTQLHVVDGSSTHLMVSILGMGEGPQVSGAADRLARKALAKLVRR